MKKITILAFLAIFTGLLFSRCEKKETSTTQSSYIEEKKDLEIDTFEIYVSNLIKETGIDIYSLSNLEELSPIVNRIDKIIDRCIVQNEKNGSSSSEMVQYYYDRMTFFYNNGDNLSTLLYYDSLCAYCQSVYSFLFDNDLDAYYIPEINNTLYLPIMQMNTMQAEINDLYLAISKQSDDFSSINTDKQNEVMKATICINLFQEDGKYYSVSDCEKKARRNLVLRLTAYTVAYTAAAALCSGSTIAILACEALAYGSYLSAVSDAMTIYNYDMYMCQHQ